MAAIIAIFKESKMAIVAVSITALVLVAVISIGLFSGNTENYIAESAGISYTQEGSFEFAAQSEAVKKWDNSVAIDNNTTVPGAPLIYDNETVVITEPATVIFPDTTDVVLLDQYSAVEKSGSQYKISNDEAGKDVSSSEMIMKTLSNFYIFVSSGASVTANGVEILTDEPIIVTQVHEDGSVTLYGEINQTFLSESFLVETPSGKIDYSTLLYDAEVDTDLAAITISDNEIDELAYENNGIIEGDSTNEGELSSTNEETPVDSGDSSSDTNDDTTTSNNTSTSTANSASGSVASSDDSSQSSGSSIFGLKDFFEDLFNNNSTVTPEVNVTLTPGYSTVTAAIDVFDPSSAIQGNMNAYLYDENHNLVTFKEFKPAEKVIITFDSLESDAQYTFEVEATYVTTKNEEYTGIFYSSTFNTSSISLDVKVIQQLSDSFTFNVKVPDENITYAKFEVYKTDALGNEFIGEYEVNIDEALTPEGSNIKVTGLESDTTYSINLVEMIVNGETLEGDQTLLVSTLKLTPTISAPIVYLEPLESLFKVISPEVVDPDNSIETLSYEVWEVDASGNKTHITTVEKTAQNINEYANIYVDGEIIKRNTTYQFRVVAEGFDNLNHYKVESEFSGNYIMSGIDPPVAIFSYDLQQDVTFNSINVDVELVDKNLAIVGDAVLEIYKGADKLTTSYVLAPGNNPDLKFEGLTSNTTYTLQVVADVDLQDGMGIRQDIVIGTVYITTMEIEEMQFELVMDATCPEGAIADTYTSCITETGATIQIKASGEALPFVETMSLKIIDVASGAPVYTIPLNSTQITELIQNGAVSIVIPEGILQSDTEYKVELFQLTDGANNMPFTISSADTFLTKKIAPTATNFDATYDEDTASITTEMTEFVDVDESFRKVTYNLYEATAIIGTDTPVASIVNADPNNIDVIFDVDGTVITRGNRYVVEAEVTYFNNHFEDTFSLAISSEILVDFLAPYIELTDIIITYNSIDATVEVVDTDLTIAAGNAVVELYDSNNVLVNSKSVPLNTPTVISFTGLLAKSDYTLVSDANTTFVDGVINTNLLNYPFTTGVDPSEYPIITLDSISIDEITYFIHYVSTLVDPNTLTQSVSLVFTETETGEVITTKDIDKTDLDTATSEINMSGAVDYTNETILKNMNYTMTAVASWTDLMSANFQENTAYKMVDQNGKTMTIETTNGVGTIVSSTTPNSGSRVTFEPVVGFVNEYKIRIGNSDKYIGNDSGGSLIAVDSAAAKTYVMENEGGKIYLKDKTTKLYIGPNYLGDGYELVDKAKACEFTLFLINETVSAPLDLFIPPAPLPVFEQVTLDVSDTEIHTTFKVIDPFDLINSETMKVTLYDEDMNQVGDATTTCEPDSTEACSVDYIDLDSLTNYTFKITATINLDEKGSTDIADFVVYEEVIQTEPTPPSYTLVNATFDPINRTINIYTDMTDPSDIYTGYDITFSQAGAPIATVSYVEPVGESHTNITLPLTDVPASVLVNESYTIEVTYTSDIYDSSETIATTTSLALTLNPVTADVSVTNITDTSVTIAGFIEDEHEVLLGDLVLECIETNDPTVVQTVPLGLGNISHTFTELKPATYYNFYIKADVDSDGRGTIANEVIFSATNVQTVDKLPSFVGMVATYDGTIDTVTVEMFNGLETQKIDKVDILIEDLEGNPIETCVDAPHDPTFTTITCTLQTATLTASTPYNVIANFDYTLDNGITGVLTYSAIMVPTSSLNVTNVDQTGVTFNQTVNLTYYNNSTVIKTDTSEQIQFSNDIEKVVAQASDGSQYTFYNSNYASENDHGDNYYRIIKTDDSASIYVNEGAVVEITDQSYQISPLNKRNTEVYTSETINEFNVDASELENYSFNLVESEEE